MFPKTFFQTFKSKKMRTKQLLFALSLLFLGFLACTNGDDDLLNNNDLSNILTQNSGWRVTSFIDKGKDETHDFASFSFDFNADGTLVARHHGDVLEQGTWTITSGAEKLILDIGTSKPLLELRDDWLIISQTSDKIELRDDNTDHLEVLVFER
ncbi:MAG: hypothetical protein D6714_04170 [Bacteroidetes bacterium]|nr:MAG: hypothetical protein D6714_04170 [Bacteroidota bacterium]